MKNVLRRGRKRNTNSQQVSALRDETDVIVSRVGAMFDGRFDRVADDVLEAIHSLKSVVANHERNAARRHGETIKQLKRLTAMLSERRSDGLDREELYAIDLRHRADRDRMRAHDHLIRRADVT